MALKTGSKPAALQAFPLGELSKIPQSDDGGAIEETPTGNRGEVDRLFVNKSWYSLARAEYRFGKNGKGQRIRTPSDPRASGGAGAKGLKKGILSVTW